MTKCGAWLVALLLAVIPASGAAAQRRLTGRVVGPAGEALGAADVLVQGTTIGARADETGRFTINKAPDGAQVLVVRHIGYKRALVPVSATQADVDVRLEKDVLELEKTVVTGTTTTVSSQNAANSVAVVSGEALNRAPAPTIETALQGKIPGAVISVNSGAPGGGSQVQLRGVTSINASSSPLYVVDGVIVSNTAIGSGLNSITNAGGAANGTNITGLQDQAVNRIADLNPADIENVEVLKGASAGAIYGSKGSNGVIVITTKRGASGATTINATQRIGQFSIAHKLGSRCFGSQAEAEAWYGGPLPTAWSPECHDYESEFFSGNPLSYESDLSLRGGSGATSYYVAADAKRDNAIQRGTYYDKKSVLANLSQVVGSRLTMQISNQFLHSLTDRGISGNDNSPVVAPVDVFSGTPSFFDLRAGADGQYPRNAYLPEGTNPFQDAALVKNPEDVYRYIGSVNATVSAFSSSRQTLDVTLIGGIDSYQYNSKLFSPPDAYFESADGLPGTLVANKSRSLDENLNLSATHKLISSFGTATTSVGVRQEQSALDAIYNRAQNFPAGVTDVQYGIVQSAYERQQLTRDQAGYVQEELLGLDDRLLLTGAVNAERSSANGADAHFYHYPKFAASFRPAIPSFAQGVADEVKLRLAYGKAGNRPLYGWKFTSMPYYVYDSRPALRTSQQVGDADIRPETSTELEGGADVQLFHGRASLEATLFRKTVDDLILLAAVAPSTGSTSAYINGGAIKNTGTEIAFNVTPVDSRALTWVSHTTFAKVNGLYTRLDVPCFQGGNFFSAVYGAPYVCQGYSTTAAVVDNGYDTTRVNGAYAGRKRHLQVMESAPKFTMGFTNDVRVGPVRLSALVDWRNGGYDANLTDNYFDGAGLAADTAKSNARYAAYRQGYGVYFQKAGFVKLRELSASYTLPRTLFGRTLGHDLRLEVAGRNLKTWTPYDGYDPEISNFGNQNIGRFQDVTPYPPSRSVFFSLNASF